MPEIELGPVARPDRVPPDGADWPPADGTGPPSADGADLLSFGPDRGDPAGGRLRSRWHRLRLPDRWRRPVPRPVVAAVSAVVAGAAVAVYLNGAADPPPPLQPVPVLAPESWLDVQDQRGGFHPFGSDLPTPPPDRVVAAHPAEAVAVVPLTLYGSALVALPPGDYQVRASCELSGSPQSLPDPVPVEVSVLDGEHLRLTSDEVGCDGAVWRVAKPVTIVDYQAFYVHYGPAGPLSASETYDPYLDLEQAGPVVVVSVTPVR